MYVAVKTGDIDKLDDLLDFAEADINMIRVRISIIYNENYITACYMW